MRHRGHRAADSGRHRRSRVDSAEPVEEDGDSPALRRSRRFQPRDALGRFRKATRDELRCAGSGPDRPPVPDDGNLTWRDFELDDTLPRTSARPLDAFDLRDGRRNCGPLEDVVYRQWSADEGPVPPDVVRAVDSLAELPDALKELLAEGLDGIYVGSGGVPELDDMQYLRGEPLPSGKATWDICAGAYGDRKIVVGDRPSPTPDVMLHEIGHALDDIDGSIEPGAGNRQWQSDTPEFRALYDECRPHLASDFHTHGEDLGRHEFFADAFAAIASRQRPALVDMLGGDTRTALNVMLFFNRKYGI